MIFDLVQHILILVLREKNYGFLNAVQYVMGNKIKDKGGNEKKPLNYIHLFSFYTFILFVDGYL